MSLEPSGLFSPSAQAVPCHGTSASLAWRFFSPLAVLSILPNSSTNTITPLNFSVSLPVPPQVSSIEDVVVMLRYGLSDSTTQRSDMTDKAATRHTQKQK